MKKLLQGLHNKQTTIEQIEISNKKFHRYTNEFWTSKQRQATSIHEVSYRACFKPQLPHFFISAFTRKGDTVYDPFNGRGTTSLEAALMERNVIANDVNPLSKILTEGRFAAPEISEIEERLNTINFNEKLSPDIDLSMFYHKKTLTEILSLKQYLSRRKQNNEEDGIDKWIRMVATNRLTGHSKGFFSVYTLPPNQAVTPERQTAINKKLNQQPEYKDVKKIISRKSSQLLKQLSATQKILLHYAARKAKIFSEDARNTSKIKTNSIQLTVTSPPFLDIVDYRTDNWLRCWFNEIDVDKIESKISVLKKIEDWSTVMGKVFHELYRITKEGGWVAFEVGELRNGKIKLDEYVVPLGLQAGFSCKGIIINSQRFTKTSNIWGIKNNYIGTNTNRIVLFQKT